VAILNWKMWIVFCQVSQNELTKADI